MNIQPTTAQVATAQALNDSLTASQVIEHAKASGWRGDSNRFGYQVNDDLGAFVEVRGTAAETATYKGKYALCLWIACQSEQPAPAAPAPVEQPAPMPAQLFEATPAPAAPVQQPAPAPQVQADKAAQLLDALRGLVTVDQPLDPEAVRAIVQEELAKQPSRTIEVKQADRDPVKIDGAHPMFEKVLRLTAAGLNVMLTGSAGTGKTYLAEQTAKALNRNYGALHCTAGASESQLLGWLLPTGEGGRFEYVSSQFATLYGAGNSVFLLDEMDAADPNFLLVINGALANGHLHIPQRYENPSVERGEGFSLIAACNTFGTGADMLFAGRNQLDAATLDRFYIVHIDYQPALEAAIMGADIPAATPWQSASLDPVHIAADLLNLKDWLDGIRAKATASKLRRIISTRAYQKAAAARRAGIPASEIKRDLLAGWTADELRKVGE